MEYSPRANSTDVGRVAKPKIPSGNNKHKNSIVFMVFHILKVSNPIVYRKNVACSRHSCSFVCFSFVCCKFGTRGLLTRASETPENQRDVKLLVSFVTKRFLQTCKNAHAGREKSGPRDTPPPRPLSNIESNLLLL